jgi:hypothetical protein
MACDPGDVYAEKVIGTRIYSSARLGVRNDKNGGFMFIEAPSANNLLAFGHNELLCSQPRYNKPILSIRLVILL